MQALTTTICSFSAPSMGPVAYGPLILHRGRCSTVFLADSGCACGIGSGKTWDETFSGPSSSGWDRSKVVIKVYHKAAMQQRHHLNVAREIALLTRLRIADISGVVRLLGTGECASNVYLTFAECEGGDLYVRIRNGSCAAMAEATLCREVRHTSSCS